MITAIAGELVGTGLSALIIYLFRERFKGWTWFDRFRGIVQWLGISSILIFTTLFLTGLLCNEINDEAFDFLFPAFMGYMAFVLFGLPVILWFLEKVWKVVSRLAWR